jgi:predicted phosphodiesterase
MTSKLKLLPWNPEPYQAYENDDQDRGVSEGVRSRQASRFSIPDLDVLGQWGQYTGNAAGPSRVQIGDGDSDEDEDEDDLYGASPPRHGSLRQPQRQKPRLTVFEPAAFPAIDSEIAMEQSSDTRPVASSSSSESRSPSAAAHETQAERTRMPGQDTAKLNTNTSKDTQARGRSTRPAKGIRFHYVSDLHLELDKDGYESWDFIATAPYLILAGDNGSLHPAHIERYRGFLIRMCQKPIIRSVFWIAGNHEFSHGPDDEPGVEWRVGVEIARRMAKDPAMGGKLKYLDNNRTFVREGGVKVIILGATLWTSIPDGHVWDDKTQNTNRRNVDHAASVRFLKNQVARIRSDERETDSHILIITHHAPSKSGTLDQSLTAPEPDDEVGYRYATDLLNGVRQPRMNGYNHSSVQTRFPQVDNRDVWIHGHTHWISSFGQVRANGVRLLSNQRGYEQERGAFGRERFAFDASKTVEI